MADLVLEKPAKEGYWLVRLKWGDPDSPSFWRSTDANEDLLVGRELYLGTSLLEVKAAASTGVFERQTWEFDLPAVAAQQTLLDALSTGRAHSDIEITALEYSIEGGEAQVLTFLEGTITEVVRNPGGHAEIVRFRAETLKAETQRAVGMQSDENCIWTFGDLKTCGKNIVNLREGGSMTAVSGLTVTITGLSVQRDRYWNRGFIEKDGVRIKIKEWISGTSFLLTRFVPLVWENSLPFNVDVVPGCDKTLKTCSLWGQVIERLAPGEVIPEYNPTMAES